MRCCGRGEKSLVDIGRRRMESTGSMGTALAYSGSPGTCTAHPATWPGAAGGVEGGGGRWHCRGLGREEPALVRGTNTSWHGFPTTASVLKTTPPRCRQREGLVSDWEEYEEA